MSKSNKLLCGTRYPVVGLSMLLVNFETLPVKVLCPVIQPYFGACLRECWYTRALRGAVTATGASSAGVTSSAGGTSGIGATADFVGASG